MADLAELARTTLASYRFMCSASEIHVRGRDFGDGTGSDQRVPVQL